MYAKLFSIENFYFFLLSEQFKSVICGKYMRKEVLQNYPFGAEDFRKNFIFSGVKYFIVR